MDSLTQTRFIRFLDNPTPTTEEVIEVFQPLAAGEYDPVHTAALLATIRTRGETKADLSGVAQAFLAVAHPFPVTGQGIIDTAGTGGDGLNTINITTGASMIAAAAGQKVIKCGNRSVSSRSGSADVLEALGIPLTLDCDAAVRQLDNTHFTFLFAPAYHPAVAHVVPVRQALKVPTIFNTMGPILSPVRPEYQIMGIANPQLGQTIAEVFRDLGRRRALVIHGSGMDEIALHGATTIWELNEHGEISHFEITPESLGLNTYPLHELTGGSAAENAEMLRKTFAGHGTPAHRDALAASAGAIFYVHGRTDSIKEGVELALDLLSDGTVDQWLTAQEGALYNA
ncbi:anthranilate phosphoribosyltransferase [Corynebacterium kutscheri]|uniref:Anthranilate phosphoribosyltransferase n=1 Tax=Corynebacterium kutscheri TaxID=35755 RepID=A0AB38VR42_9CORY|nr:anthranilate phosphoribosyltransferase [Corynebacterium kutscheri]VEH05648.1 anthranilate phosphoribosyltransferase [Corynebacterium kutscheri]